MLNIINNKIEDHINTHDIFYSALKEIRELFHKSGRIDDSNAKLDEIVKLISIYLYQIKNKDIKNNLSNLVLNYQSKPDSFEIVVELKELFKKVSFDKMFLNNDKTSIFGSEPKLNLHNSDKEFTYKLVRLVIDSMDSFLNESRTEHNFDILNETFGHFVRDNFRGNIEDAQYMTPPEVVEIMIQMAINDMEAPKKKNTVFRVLDPSCGVGSFLSSFYKNSKDLSKFSNYKFEFIGQDKVDRMVRLSKLNMQLFNTKNTIITHDNSIIGHSILDDYNNKIDLILSNPPFGAKFSSKEVFDQPKENYPNLHDLSKFNNTNFDSELLFIDRSLALLKPGGKLIIVLPDSVISSSGMAETLRYKLSNKVTIKAIIELPNVTFAQAGTRTKTSILYLEKTVPDDDYFIFMALSKEIGFQVSSRKGVQLKIREGNNDLIKIFDKYIEKNNIPNSTEINYKILSNEPSCVLVKSSKVLNKSWTPNHHNSNRYSAIDKLMNESQKDIELLPLKEVVNFRTNKRRKQILSEDLKCISILHIMNEGIINFTEVFNYKPKTPGTHCESEDILFSKINPRIPRISIVPNIKNISLTCSPEFEIMNSKIHIDNYSIMMLLLLPSVQDQIQCLTSGTSSSHNRIKTKELEQIILPIPKKGTKTLEKFNLITNEFKIRIKSLNENYMILNDTRNALNNLLS